MKDEYEVQLVEKEQAVVSVQSEYEVKLAAKDKEYAASSQTIEEQTVEIQECRVRVDFDAIRSGPSLTCGFRAACNPAPRSNNPRNDYGPPRSIASTWWQDRR